MKKLVLILSLLLVGISASAQKRYIFIYSSAIDGDGHLSLYGELPNGIKSYYSGEDNENIALVLNKLYDLGYEIEHTITGSSTYSLVLSNADGSGSSNSVKTVRADDNEDVREVARYNLQGMPVSKKTKGIQIVVYSNYTTQTVIVE